MKTKTYLFAFLLALGAMATFAGVNYLQTQSSDLMACCPPEDPECDEDPDDDGGNNSDTMPTQIRT